MPAKTTKTNAKVDFNAFQAGQDAWMKMMQDGQAMMQSMVADAQTRMEDMQKDLGIAKIEADLPVAAFNDAGKVYAKGAEAIGAEWMAFSKAMIEANVAASKEVFAAKTLQEAAEINVAHMQKTADDMAAQMTKASEMSVQTMQDAAKPLQAQMNSWMEQAAKKAA